MTARAIQSLREALGVSRPIRIAVDEARVPQSERDESHSSDAHTAEARAKGQRIEEIERPYGVIGRGSKCDITLADRHVSFRHAYLQAFGDRVYCIDLMSPNSLVWKDASHGGWMSADQDIGIGPFSLSLQDDGWASDFDGWPSPLDCRTRTDESTPFGALPLVHLEILNHQFKGMTWPINRVLTLVGRDERCRITCADERISRVHCSLLLTAYGLWVIDLLGRGGIRINNKVCQFARLSEGDELRVGQYVMRGVYETVPKELSATSQRPPDTDEIAIPPELLSPEDSLPSPEFLTRNNKIFPVTISSPVMIVEPKGGVRSAGYQEIQLESNIVTQLLKTRSKLLHLVVDIHHADAMDSIVINAIMAMCRAAKGKAVICNASEMMLSVLTEMNLTKVWPHFATREEALHYVSSEE